MRELHNALQPPDSSNGEKKQNEGSNKASVEIILPEVRHQASTKPPNTTTSSLMSHVISCASKTTSNPPHLATTIVAITPTYKRLTQKLDLVSLCQTIMHVPNFLWIVIEDSLTKSAVVEHVLHNCHVNSVHLNMITSKETKKAGQRGVEQRNAGLQWARNYCKEKCENNCSGVVYFMDDDNKYDLRLFEQVCPACHIYMA